jgi:tetratricopeptide (TPR) repeat protein
MAALCGLSLLSAPALAQDAAAVSYQDILNNPDDPVQNIAYARSQIDAGNLKGASVTLERVLLLNPAAADVRLLYGIVLFRLGDMDTAQWQLEEARRAGLDPKEDMLAAAYLGRIRARVKRTQFRGSMQAGVEYNSNLDQAPLSGQFLSFGTPTGAPSGRDDFAIRAAVEAELSHQVGRQQEHKIFLGGSYFELNQFDENDFDLRAFSGRTGMTFDLGRVFLTPQAVGAYATFGNEPYLSIYGGSLTAELDVTPSVRTHIGIRGVQEDYDDELAFLEAIFRTGPRYTGSFGVRWNANAWSSFQAEATATIKDGEQEFESFDAAGFDAAYVLGVGRGQYFLVNAGFDYVLYDGPSVFIDPFTTREDWQFQAGLTYGLPLSALFGRSALGDVHILASYEYRRTDSNIPNFEFDSNIASLSLKKAFEF